MAKLYAERRDELLATAQDLFFSRGYENCTVNDIIDAVGIAKGTFYHYFRGKEDLLEELAERLSTDILQVVNAIALDRSRSAADRMAAYFQQSLIIKAGRRELIIPLLDAMYRPENTLFRLRIVERTNQRVAPVLAAMIGEGVTAGEFLVDDPAMCGEFIIRSFTAFSEKMGRMILDRPAGAGLMQELHRLFDFMEWSLARLLGVEPGSIVLADRAVADQLFGAAQEHLA
jgi:AcrR family transcriptional regulator